MPLSDFYEMRWLRALSGWRGLPTSWCWVSVGKMESCCASIDEMRAEKLNWNRVGGKR